MTAAGQSRHDATGRSTAVLKVHTNARLEGPFIAHTKELFSSPVWRALSLVDRRVLDRLEIEHMAHGGTENGNLKCTYADFEAFGLRRASLAPALRKLTALGLVEIVERGRIAKGEFRFPAKYRLTYVTGNLAATNEWRKYATVESVAKRIAEIPKPEAKPKKQKAGHDNATVTGRDNVTAPGHDNATPVPDTETQPPYISWEGTPESEAHASRQPKQAGELVRVGDAIPEHLRGTG